VEHTDNQVKLQADNEFQLNQVKDIVHKKLAQRGIDLGSLDKGKLETGNNQVRQVLIVQQGINQDIARKIVKLLKDSKLKVQVSIQGDKVRVNGKKRDDLQSAISLLKAAPIELPLQYINFRD